MNSSQESSKNSALELIHQAGEFAAKGNNEQAMNAWRSAVQIDPTLPEAHCGIGKGLLADSKVAEAMAALREAVRLRPKYGEALNLLGFALRLTGDIEAAAAAFTKSIEADPLVAEPRNNLGTALYELGRLPEAVAQHEQAVKLRPADPRAHFYLALALLGCGRWDRGWTEYEWRRKALNDPSEKLDVPQPPWTGWDPAGATLLVLCEQGLGDTLQFIRYVPVLSEAGAKVIVECQPPLKELLRGVRGVGHIVTREDPLPPFDAHVKLLSLPAILGTRLHNVPSEVPYIRAEPSREAAWGKRLRGPGIKVGINWTGSGLKNVGGMRSFPLAALASLAKVAGVRLFSLQKHVGVDQIAAINEQFKIEVFENPPLDEGKNAAFMDTAAIIRHLDLVVTCDTSVAHLAGALGARTWVALPKTVDWRWMQGRDDSPWYPTMRLFRQERPEEWGDVFERMAVALEALVKSPAPASVPHAKLMAPISPGELLDRLAILHIKTRRITDEQKLKSVRAELMALTQVRETLPPQSGEVDRIAVELRRVNEELWHVEDAIRSAEAAGDFGPRFIALARRVYRTNDRRADLKRRANVLLGSPISDEKEYRSFRRQKP